MKFARYLQENLTPEWRRAYIDYKGLKKIIKTVNPRSPSAFRRNDSSDSDDEAPVTDVSRPSQSATNTTTQPTPSSFSANEPQLTKKTSRSSHEESESGRETEAEDEAEGVQHIPLDGLPPPQLQGSPLRQPAASSFSLVPGFMKPTGLTSETSAKSPSLRASYGSFNSTPSRHGSRQNSSPRVVSLHPQISSELASDSQPSSDKDSSNLSSTGGGLERLTPASLLHRPVPERPSSTLLAPTSSSVQFRSNLPSPSFFKLKPSRQSPASNPSRTSARLSPLLPESQVKSSPVTFGPLIHDLSKKGDIAAPIIGQTAHEDEYEEMPPRTGVLGYMRRRTSNAGPPSTRSPMATLDTILPTLLPQEKNFYDAIERELNKVETFYCSREDEMKERVSVIKVQMRELAEHRKIFYQYHPTSNHLPAEYFGRVLKPIVNIHPALAPSNLTQNSNRSSYPSAINHLRQQQSNQQTNRGIAKQAISSGKEDELIDEHRHNNAKGQLSDPTDAEYDPELYKKYKRKLKLAVLECYKGLEVLKNYRILNVTGFRKALKKFEKASKIKLMDVYTKERIQKQRFSHAETVDEMIDDMENMYATRFENGNRKNARQRLRVSASTKTHHFSMYRSGLYIGFGLPALIDGIVSSFHPSVRQAVPAWGPLLQVYAAMYLPVLFAMLFYLNLTVWSDSRINYQFIFEFDLRSVLNYRQYLEIPAFLFFMLSYAFWFTFHEVGSPNIAPTTWPLAWLVFTICFFVNPINILHRPARFWFIRALWRVFTPFYSSVEFAAFFLADELNSLIFTMYNIWFLGCAQGNNWTNVYDHCEQYESWIPAVLSCLPPLLRLLQCIQRWRDSGVKIHLINAGKYLSTIVTYVFYYIWRSRGNSIRDAFFPIWFVVATAGSIYTTGWDLLIDWSLLRPDRGFLRKDLIYTGAKPGYYIAIITNVIVRFIWIGYIPPGGISLRLRAPLFYLLEMLRRFQWNFFRVENEMLGNVDQYRVTRELPLPYDLSREPDSSEGEEAEHTSILSPRMKGKSLF
ncbi:Predicted small molecule transporter [Phaffia rhodozyma]|uniref:Predicted small molecule transporter n=1 Tax=Phaffia rhodozyma TaxID=264483 RepID=A0A0F7SIY5_PHARH|nr:Predicted small molecule transporter [Phaffia rhodozyma]